MRRVRRKEECGRSKKKKKKKEDKTEGCSPVKRC